MCRVMTTCYDVMCMKSSAEALWSLIGQSITELSFSGWASLRPPSCSDEAQMISIQNFLRGPPRFSIFAEPLAGSPRAPTSHDSNNVLYLWMCISVMVFLIPVCVSCYINLKEFQKRSMRSSKNASQYLR